MSSFSPEMHPCDFCTKCYPGSKLLHRHVQSAHFNDMPMCDLCCKSFPDLKSLDKHKETHLAEFHVPCPVCGFVLPGDTVDRHVNEHHPMLSNWLCDGCGKAFQEVDDFRSHIEGCPDDPQKKSRHRRVQCCLCDRPFDRDREFLEHMEDMHGEVREEFGKCEECCEIFYSCSDMLKHEGNCRVPTLERLIKKRWECKLCPNTRTKTYRTFHKEKYLRKHQENVHAVEQPEVPCFDCDRNFPSFSKLLVHVKDCHDGVSEADLE